MSVVLIFCIVVLLVYLIQTKYRLYVISRKLAGPWAIPLLGNVQMITKLRPESLFLTITENRRKYQRSYRLWLGTQLWIFLHTPEETRDALNDPTLCKADTFNQLNPLIGNGLLISHGKHWDNHRRALGPAFHPNVLNSFTETIIQHADKLVNKLFITKGQYSIEVNEFLFPCILDAIIETSMGKKLNAQDDCNSIYTQAFHSASNLLFQRMVNPLLAFDFIFQRTKLHKRLQSALHIIHELMENVIHERAEFLKKNFENDAEFSSKIMDMQYKRRRTLLDTLLTTVIDGESLSFQAIRDEVNTFVFAGVDTTTAAMGFVLYSLAKYPAMQRKIQQEIKEILTNDQTESESPITLTNTQINCMEYLDMFIKECLRYYTIVPVTGRQTTADTKIGNIEYCAGITLWINMYGLAHDENFFEDPYEFRPERFSKENQVKLPPFSYIPFSGGPHVCIGRKYAWLIIKILTIRILQNFEITLKNPNEELVLMAQMVLKSLHGINLIFKQRHH